MKIVIALVFAFTLSACGTTDAEPTTSPSDSTSPTASYSAVPQSAIVPKSCEDSGIVELLKSEYGKKELRIIPPPEVPTEGTKLWDVLSNGGISCAFVAENSQGMRIDWLPDDGQLFDQITATYQGTEKVTIPGADPNRAVYLYVDDTGQGASGWSLSFVADGVWIEILTNFPDFTTLESGADVVAKAIAAINN